MINFFSNSHVTKGVLGLKSALSLLTKGILDGTKIKGGGSPSLIVQDYLFDFNLIGQKQFKESRSWKLFGFKQFVTEEELVLVGKISKRISFEKLLVGKRLEQELFERQVRAFKSFKVFENLFLDGRKSTEYQYGREI